MKALNVHDLLDLQIIDLHVHVGPELVCRRYDPLSLASELSPLGIGAVIKNHFYPTTPLAALARSQGHRLIFGSVTLNYGVGGLNPEAIRAAISGNKMYVPEIAPDDAPLVVWMPTIHAAAHLAAKPFDLDPAWGAAVRYCRPANEIVGITVLDGDRVRPEAIQILEVIRQENMILATGHLGGEEVWKLAQKASAMGIQRIIVTHPFYPPTNLTIAEQQALAQYPGVYIEHTYAVHLVDGISLDKYVESIGTVGIKHTILTSDLGQVNRPPLAQGLCDYFNALIDRGITQDEIVQMAADNPAALLRKGGT